MNYSSVQEMFDSGITNMTCIRNNQAMYYYDKHRITAPSWLTYRGAPLNEFDFTGSSGFIFTQGKIFLYVNNTQSFYFRYLYTEEGTVNGVRFFRVRAKSTRTASQITFTYDTVFWETGDICIKGFEFDTIAEVSYIMLIDLPTNSFQGQQNFNHITVDNPVVTLYYNAEARNYEVKYEQISFEPDIPEDAKKYLIKSSGLFYTLKSGALEQVSGTEASAMMFVTDGFDTLPVWDDIKTLDDPEILYWCASESDLIEMTANMTGTPLPHNLISNKINIGHESILGIEKMLVTCEGELLVAVSVDEKQTWKAWTGSQWVNVSNELSGMSKASLEAVTVDQWNQLITGAEGLYIRVTFVNSSQSLTKILIDFIN